MNDPIFEFEKTLQSVKQKFPSCTTWTKRNINHIFSGQHSAYNQHDFVRFFRCYLGLPEQQQQQISMENDVLEVWQKNRRIDIVYYFKTKRMLRLHAHKRQMYKPHPVLFPDTKMDTLLPVVWDEDRVNLDLLSIFIICESNNPNPI
jgi:hypothetical protein